MPELLRFSKNLILDYLRSEDIDYSIDDDGDIVVDCNNDAEGIEWRVWLMVAGSDDNIFRMMSQAPFRFGREHYGDGLEIANEWSANSYWPKVYLQQDDDDDDFYFELEWAEDLSKGVTADQFTNLVFTFTTTVEDFWVKLNEQLH